MSIVILFFFNDTATTEIYTLSLHDALPICLGVDPRKADQMVRGTVNLPHGTGKTARVIVFATGDKAAEAEAAGADVVGSEDRKSTRLNSSHANISYAVFCLKKKNKHDNLRLRPKRN